jgi:hypothetical protein
MIEIEFDDKISLMFSVLPRGTFKNNILIITRTIIAKSVTIKYNQPNGLFIVSKTIPNAVGTRIKSHKSSEITGDFRA